MQPLLIKRHNKAVNSHGFLVRSLLTQNFGFVVCEDAVERGQGVGGGSIWPCVENMALEDARPSLPGKLRIIMSAALSQTGMHHFS